MRMAAIDVTVLCAYAVGIFTLGQWVSRRSGKSHQTSTDYFLASKSLPWWAIGASLIAANISAEQIVGMSGSGYAIGLAIASYEWMAALTLLIVGKWFLPIFLANDIYTMPQFLDRRFGPSLRTVMAIFWLGLYVFVNLTSILWLGSIAVHEVAGVNQTVALVGLGIFALTYQIRGGLRTVALTDIVQVSLLILGGLIVAFITLSQIGAGSGVLAGFETLVRRAPDHFVMILPLSSPFYKDLPGISVLIGGMWIANLSYWGFNQYIIQRALAAKSLPEAQKGVLLAAFLKLLMPVIIVLPGIAAVVLAPHLAKPDQAYPTMMQAVAAGYPRPGVRRPGGGDRRVGRVEDQLDRDDLHPRPLRQAPARQPRTPSGDGRSDRGVRRGRPRDAYGASAAGRVRPSIPVHPGIHRLLHAGDRGDLPAGAVLEAGH